MAVADLLAVGVASLLRKRRKTTCRCITDVAVIFFFSASKVFELPQGFSEYPKSKSHVLASCVPVVAVAMAMVNDVVVSVLCLLSFLSAVFGWWRRGLL